MARDVDLIGLGMPPNLASALSATPIFTSVSGTSAGTAVQLNGRNKFYVISASNTGSGAKVPQVGGDNGAMPGDELFLMNAFAADIQLYAAANPAGSAVIFWNAAASVAGTTGIIVSSGVGLLLYPVTASVWMVFKQLGSA